MGVAEVAQNSIVDAKVRSYLLAEVVDTLVCECPEAQDWRFDLADLWDVHCEGAGDEL